MTWATSTAFAPTEEPVALADMKAHLRITHSEDDAYIEALIGAARAVCEQRAGLCLLTQTVDIIADDWPDEDDAVLPVHPIQSVTHLRYYDAANALQTCASTVYQVTTFGVAPRISLAFGQVWPIAYARPDAVTLRVVAGYGASGDAVPLPIRQWIMLHAAALYEQREAVLDGQTTAQLSPLLDGLLDRYRVPQGV